MEKLRKIIYVSLSVIAILLAICSILSIFTDTENRFLKMLDFPRIQFFVASLVSLILFVLMSKHWQWYDYLLVIALISGLAINGSYLINYTPLVAEQVPTADARQLSDEDQIGILLVNVKMSNRKAEPLLELIISTKPDIIIGMEIDEWWNEQLRSIEKDYPYTTEQINNVAYGMVLYSKLPLEDVQVQYLNNQKVPSFESVVKLKNDKSILLYAMHPVPPKRFKNLPDNKGKSEKEMVKLGDIIKKQQLPTIVAGDINDVSWGNTGELIETKDLLFDVRVGRGFYNSFNADNIFMRWPLDHAYVTEEFKVVELKRLDDIGSDHFPIYVKLAL